MSEQKTKDQEFDEKIEKIKQSLTDLNNKDFKIYYFCPSLGSNQASGGVGVLYQHVFVLRQLKYDAVILHEKSDYEYPIWMGDKYEDLPHVSLEGTKLQVKPCDFLIIPEGFSNIMESTKGLACRRIVFAQSWAYILNSLMPGMSWRDFGINHTMTVCQPIQDYIENLFGKENQEIKICRQYIDSELFTPSTKPRKPFIAISSRDQMEGLNIIKTFYLKYPQYKWITFKDMKGMDRETFADTLKECCLAIFSDRISGFGTFPIEAAKCDVPVIALIPEITPEYANDESAIWTNSLLNIADLAGNFTKLWLEDNIPEEMTKGTRELAKKYSEKDGIEEIKRTFEEYISERKQEFTKFIRENQVVTQDLLEESEVK